MKNSMRKILDAVIYAVTGVCTGDNHIPRTAHATIWFLAWMWGGLAVLIESGCGVDSFWIYLLTAVPVIFISGRIMGKVTKRIIHRRACNE